jgi:rhodanese-related sulfurtransferase
VYYGRPLLTLPERGDHNTIMSATLMTKEELRQALESADDRARPVALDARLKYAYEHSTLRLPGAVRLPPNATDVPALSKARPIVVYCSDPDEITSRRVAAAFVANGYDARVLKGGVSEWISANLPTEPKGTAPQG